MKTPSPAGRRHTLLVHLPSVLLLALVAAAGCATASAGSGEDGEPARGSSSLIIRAELEPLHQLSAYQAVERLRPRWLRQRLGRIPRVVVEGNPGQGLDILRSIRATDIRQMRFLAARDATTRWGTGYDGGAIVVELLGSRR